MVLLIVLPISLYLCTCIAARPRVAARMLARTTPQDISSSTRKPEYYTADLFWVYWSSWFFALAWCLYLPLTTPISRRDRRNARRGKQSKTLFAWQDKYEVGSK